MLRESSCAHTRFTNKIYLREKQNVENGFARSQREIQSQPVHGLTVAARYK